MNIDALKKIGGTEWTNDAGEHRVYMKNLGTLFGLRCNRYGTGNISAATFRGEPISNSRAREISEALGLSKVWYDVNANKFAHKVVRCRTYSADYMADEIIKEISRRAEEFGA